MPSKEQSIAYPRVYTRFQQLLTAFRQEQVQGTYVHVHECMHRSVTNSATSVGGRLGIVTAGHILCIHYSSPWPQGGPNIFRHTKL